MTPADLLSSFSVDAGWLADQLAQSGVAAVDAHIDALESTFIGTGQVGENVRCALTWRDPDSGPASVVIKLPAIDETSRATAALTETYIREVGFYRDLQWQVPIRTPACFHVSENRADNSFILVMEDMTPAAQGDQLTGCSLDEATLAVRQIARLHGPTWDRTELKNLDWVTERTPEVSARHCDLLRMLWPGFLERYEDVLTPDVLDAGRELVDRIDLVLAPDDAPGCIVHGDFRLDNILFGNAPGVARVTTVDWQTAAWRSGPEDVAYFLSGALSPEVRRANETSLLARYHNSLESHGPNVDLALIVDGYRRGAGSGYIMAIIASQLVGQTERGDAMFVAMATGSAHLMNDVDFLSAF